MKKSGCAIIALFLAVCASMFVNLLLFAALVGVKGTRKRRCGQVAARKGF